MPRKYTLSLAITQYWTITLETEGNEDAEAKAFRIQHEYQNKIAEQCPPPDGMVLEDWENNLDDMVEDK